MTRPGDGPRRMFRLPPSESTVARDIDEEIAHHIETRVEALVAEGAPPAEARRQAAQEFGDVASARSELASIDRVTLRRDRRAAWWDGLWQDTRLALRGMRRNVAFTAAVVVTLALGIGVNAAMFGITDRLLLSPPAHVTDADDVVRVLYHHAPSGEPTNTAILPYPDYAALRDGVAGFATVGAYSPGWPSVLGRGRDALEIQLVSATASLFATLGVEPALGRFFTEAEDALPRGERVVVLSHSLWQSRFGGDRAVIGRSIDIDHASWEVIGVAPRGFNGMDLDPVHAWVPVSAVGPDRGGDEWYAFRGMHWLYAVARLAPGVSVDAAQAEASAVFLAANDERFADDASADILLGSAIRARAPAVGVGTAQQSGRIAFWLFGVSVLVLVIACANVANLLLARGMRRQREMGVRLALGVGRLRIARQVLTETVVIALAGAALGLLLAHWVGSVFRALLLPDVEWVGSPIDGRVLAVAGASALLSVLLAGLLPAWYATRGDAAGLLAGGGRGTHRRSRVRSGLVALQATLAVLLLVGAGLFVRSLHGAAAIPLGYEPDRVVLLSWYTTGLDWNAARAVSLYDAGLQRLRTVPGVEGAALTMTAPMYSAYYGQIRVPGLDSVPQLPGRDMYSNAVSPDYFRVMGARMVRGREFSERDVAGSNPVAIITQTMADVVWPGEEVIGKCFVHVRDEGQPCREVIGVTEPTRYSALTGEPAIMYYLPMAQQPPSSWRSIIVRVRPDGSAAVQAARAALQSLESGLPHVQAVRLSERLDPQLQPWRLGATLFTAFGALALVLAGLGLYGVVMYDVVQRRRELGVRVALGAGAPRVMRMVVGDAVRVVIVGLLIGLAAAGYAAQFVEPLLFDVSPRDPLVLGGAALLLLASAVVAAAMPAWRAAGVQPTEALREE